MFFQPRGRVRASQPACLGSFHAISYIYVCLVVAEIYQWHYLESEQLKFVDGIHLVQILSLLYKKVFFLREEYFKSKKKLTKGFDPPAFQLKAFLVPPSFGFFVLMNKKSFFVGS